MEAARQLHRFLISKGPVRKSLERSCLGWTASAALSEMPCQRFLLASSFFLSSFTTDRAIVHWYRSGRRPVPHAFWMMNSILSPLGRPWYRVHLHRQLRVLALGDNAGSDPRSDPAAFRSPRFRTRAVSPLSLSLERICSPGLHPQHIFYMVHIRAGDHGLRLCKKFCFSKKMIHYRFLAVMETHSPCLVASRISKASFWDSAPRPPAPSYR